VRKRVHALFLKIVKKRNLEKGNWVLFAYIPVKATLTFRCRTSLVYQYSKYGDSPVPTTVRLDLRWVVMALDRKQRGSVTFNGVQPPLHRVAPPY